MFSGFFSESPDTTILPDILPLKNIVSAILYSSLKDNVASINTDYYIIDHLISLIFYVAMCLLILGVAYNREHVSLVSTLCDSDVYNYF